MSKLLIRLKPNVDWYLHIDPGTTLEVHEFNGNTLRCYNIIEDYFIIIDIIDIDLLDLNIYKLRINDSKHHFLSYVLFKGKYVALYLNRNFDTYISSGDIDYIEDLKNEVIERVYNEELKQIINLI